MSNYRNSDMHKSIMAEKAKQDADTKAKAKKSTAKDSAFVKKASPAYEKYTAADAKRKKILSNPIGAAAAWLRNKS